jgi:outer membrane protein TolC
MKILVAVLLVLIVDLSFGNELKRLIDFALENNPRLKSYKSLKKSFVYKAEFSKSLPNPQIAFALNNLDTDRYFPDKKNPMSSFGLYISQKYTLPIKREKSSEVFVQRSSEVDVMEEKFRKNLIKDLKVLYWEFSYSFEIEKILRDTEEEIKALIDITEEKYRYGKALLSDLILLRVELLKVKEMLAKAQRIRETSLERIQALAGGRIELKGLPLKTLNFPPDFNPERNVDVKLINQKLKTIKKEIERVKIEHYPDIFLSAGYAIRPDIPNLITLRIGFTVPLWKEKRENMLVLEKKELYSSKLLELEDVKLKVSGEFNALRDSYRISSDILSTVNREIEEKRKEIEALLIAYEYDRTDIREILRAYRLLWALELDRAKLIKELNQTVAKAEALL